MKEKLFFGTDGLRGNAELFPFTPDALFVLGKAIAQWSQEKHYTKNSSFIIAHDTRASCAPILQFLVDGLHSEHADCFYSGILPTPALQVVLKHHPSIQCGIMISASHNPAQDNGIKLFTHEGKLTLDDEKHISELFSMLYETSDVLPFSDKKTIHDITAQSQSIYLSYLRSHITPLSLSSKKIVVDCAHGATFNLVQKAFEGTQAHLILCNSSPNGTNINHECGSLVPSYIHKKVIAEKADIGFAFDGDGDRVIIATKNGTIKDGDDILALLLTNASYANISTVVGTVMTNYGLEKHLATREKKLIRTSVGDKYIAAYLSSHNLLLGGETSGHIIIRSYITGGDGLFIALKILETLESTNNWECTTFEKYPQYLVNIPTARKDNLENPRYASIIKHYETELAEGRLLVRFSGTENVLRVMSEDKNKERAFSVAHALAHDLQKLLESDIKR